jgi:hypothetical protein
MKGLVVVCLALCGEHATTNTVLHLAATVGPLHCFAHSHVEPVLRSVTLQGLCLRSLSDGCVPALFCSLFAVCASFAQQPSKLLFNPNDCLPDDRCQAICVTALLVMRYTCSSCVQQVPCQAQRSLQIAFFACNICYHASTCPLPAASLFS